MIRSNAHTHTTWCDGMNTPAEVAKAAFALGFTDLGFSSHAPSPGSDGIPPIDEHGVGMRDEAGYRADIAALKTAYEGRMGILCGVEKDYYEKIDPACYDYVIGDLHYFEGPDGILRSVDMSPGALRETIDELFAGDALAAARCFYEKSAENVRVNRPDIVGHFDLIAKFNEDGSFFDEAGRVYQSTALAALDDIIGTVQGYGGMIELNLSVFAKGQRSVPYPAPFLLRHMAQRDARVLPTSDSHRAETLNAGFEEAPKILRRAGFTSMAVLQNGRFVDVKL